MRCCLCDRHAEIGAIDAREANARVDYIDVDDIDSANPDSVRS